MDDETLTEVPILILGNKIDIPSAASEEELRMAFGINHTTGKDKSTAPAGERAIELFMCSVVRTTGYSEGKAVRMLLIKLFVFFMLIGSMPPAHFRTMLQQVSNGLPSSCERHAWCFSLK